MFEVISMIGYGISFSLFLSSFALSCRQFFDVLTKMQAVLGPSIFVGTKTF